MYDFINSKSGDKNSVNKTIRYYADAYDVPLILVDEVWAIFLAEEQHWPFKSWPKTSAKNSGRWRGASAQFQTLKMMVFKKKVITVFLEGKCVKSN